MEFVVWYVPHLSTLLDVRHETGTARRKMSAFWARHGYLVSGRQKAYADVSVMKMLLCLAEGNEAVEPSIRSASWRWAMGEHDTRVSTRPIYLW
jgi:hypothetical protein